MAWFATMPVGLVTAVPLVMIGFVAFSEAVWNTSRIRREADPAYQGRLQALGTMTFNQGSILGSLWGGAAVDRFGRVALLGGAAVLAALCVVVIIAARQPPEPPEHAFESTGSHDTESEVTT